MEHKAILEKGAQTLVALTDIWNDLGLPEERRSQALADLNKKLTSVYDDSVEDARKARGTGRFPSF